MKGAGARLSRALGNFFLDLHTQEHGYTEILPPALANANITTYTNDSERNRQLLEVMYRTRGSNAAPEVSAKITRIVDRLPFARTETTVNDSGIDRRTVSSFGQIGAVISLVAAASTGNK